MAQPGKPTFLFLHGFPSSASDWSNQITYFSSLGYGVVAPDLLGCGQTSKPKDPEAYNWHDMSAHIKAILDAEGVSKTIGVGHDLGSWFLSRLCHLLPDCFVALVFIDVGYSVPGERFDVDMINHITKRVTGEEKFRYWDLFTSDDGVALMDRNPASVISLLHAEPAAMARNMGPPGRAHAWIAASTLEPMHLKDGGARYFNDKVRMFSEGGFTGPTNWYKALRKNVSFADEEHMEKELHVPTLVIGCGKDEMTPANFQDQLTRPWVKGAAYQFEVLSTGHWPMLEDVDGTNSLIHEFCTREVGK